MGDRKKPPPHHFTVYHGSAHFAASRGFVEYAVNDQKARDLHDWFADTHVPDEQFFSTLNYNPHLGVPGAFKGTYI